MYNAMLQDDQYGILICICWWGWVVGGFVQDVGEFKGSFSDSCKIVQKCFLVGGVV